MLSSMLRLLKNIVQGKESLTLTLTMSFAFILFLIMLSSIVIMFRNGEIDHYIIGELIVFVLTLLGIKKIPSSDKKTCDRNH